MVATKRKRRVPQFAPPTQDQKDLADLKQQIVDARAAERRAIALSRDALGGRIEIMAILAELAVALGVDAFGRAGESVEATASRVCRHILGAVQGSRHEARLCMAEVGKLRGYLKRIASGRIETGAIGRILDGSFVDPD